MRKLTAFCALLLTTAPGLARAAEPPCLTAGEFAALAGYAMPSVINGTAQRCAATLGPDAFLRKSGSELSGRYAARKPVAWPGAKAAFLKLSASTNADANRLFTQMPDPSLQQVVDAMLEGMVSQQIPLDRCATIDKVVGLLSPLPPENTAELVALAVGLGSKSGGGKLGKIAVCPA